MKMLVVLGEGGHTKEIITLVDMLGDDIAYGYIVVEDDEVSASKIRRAGPVFYVRRPRDKEHHLLRDVAKTLHSGWQAWRILRRFRPDAVLTSGPSVAVPACAFARLMGIKVIFVETGSRVTRLSLTGRIMYPVASLFIVQWPSLQQRHPKAVYAGRLF
jgi:UDP-N-acetylglucosamine:LPS N-acetylglucosamine transferase